MMKDSKKILKVQGSLPKVGGNLQKVSGKLADYDHYVQVFIGK